MSFRGFLLSAATLALLTVAHPGKSMAQDACSSIVGNIVNNCGFETTDFTDWTVNATADDAWSVISTGDNGIVPNSGSSFAQNGCVGTQCIQPDSSGTGSNAGNWLYQDLSTNPGDTYQLTFYYAPGGAEDDGDPVELQVLWGANSSPLTTGGSESCTGNCVYDNTSSGSNSYTQVIVTDLTATSSMTRLEFLGEQDPSWDGLDSISVVDVTATPEPASALLIGAGLIALASWRRRKP